MSNDHAPGQSFLNWVGGEGGGHDADEALAQATACLDRFTDAFNACELAGMDAQLHFPHVMLAGGKLLTWASPGQHPPDLFDALKATGWTCTVYVERHAVLVLPGKVHLRVVYDRMGADGRRLSRHDNLWVVTCVDGRWGIALRSY